LLLPALGALLLEPLTAEGAAGVHAQVNMNILNYINSRVFLCAKAAALRLLQTYAINLLALLI
jgi:hypothetical protein